MEIMKTNMTGSNQVIEQISVDNLDTIITDRRFTMIDVRSPQDIEAQGGIPGAINIPLEETIRQIDKRSESHDSILNGKGPFLFCCTGGVMSYMAAIRAQESGMKGIFNLEGGHSAWKKSKENVVLN